MQESTALRKHLSLDELVQRRKQIEDVEYWRTISPRSSISESSSPVLPRANDAHGQELARYTSQLREEGYFQTAPIIPTAMLQEMRDCIEVVRERGFPVMFALVYDVFYAAFSHFDSVLAGILGPGYTLIPNFWVYYVDPNEAGKGFEPHRDAEYSGTIAADGTPTVVTLWITVTEATPLNSCIYLLPKNRDPQYAQACSDLTTGATQFNLEDIRALPTAAGVLSCWDQYIYHWGSRSSKHADEPRISYAMYCQRGDTPPVDNSAIDLRRAVDFKTRLGLICRGMHRYSYLSVSAADRSQAVRSFLQDKMAALSSS